MVLNTAGASLPRDTHRRLILFTACLAMLMAQLDTSVVNLALKQISVDLRIGVSALQWVIDAYNLVYGSLLLTAGTLGDLYGRRRVFAVGAAVFVIGSLMCSMAPDATILIAGRALTGLGAALLVPISLAILTVAYPDAKERAQAIGIWASSNGLAFAIGPTVGGLLVRAAGWRSIFLVIVPVGALALALTATILPESKNRDGRRLDLPGQALAILALGTLTLAAIEAPHWSAVATLLCGGVSVLAVQLFLTVESYTDGALLPPALLMRRGLSASLAVTSLMTFGMYGMLFLLPLFLQSQRGASALEAGLELLPMSLIFWLVSQRSGKWAARWGTAMLMASGMALMGAGLLLLCLVSQRTRLLGIEVDLAIIGIGLGLTSGPVMSVAVASVPPARSGTASGLINTARMIGATLGVAVLGAVFAVVSQAGFVAGMRAALLIGGTGILLGAVIAGCLITRTEHGKAAG
jgi:EmrB/QacA subfamily drug resistance transporter